MAYEPLDSALSVSSGSSTPTASTSPSTATSHQASSHPAPPLGKRVSFCPLALLIGVAAEGETEPALVKAAQEQLGRRRVAIQTYSFEAPQIGDVTAKAWHSVVNGFTASLEPFLHGGAGSGRVCTRTGGRERDHSPDGAGGRRRASSLSRSRSRSPSPGRAPYEVPTFDPSNDPSFIPNSPTRVTVKLPALRRECLRSFASSPCTKSILRRCTGDFAPRCPLRARAVVDAGESAPLFPSLSHSVSMPPLAATAHADNPAALGALVPLAPCCANCESATHYGLCVTATGDDGYHERWSVGAQKKRAEEQKEREERARCASVAQEIRARYDAVEAKEGGEEQAAEQAEEEARGSRLGLLAAKGGVDELARERGRRGTPGALADGHHGYDDVDTVAVVVAPCHVPGGAHDPVQAGVPHPTRLVAAVITEELDDLGGGLDFDALGSSDAPAPSVALPPEASSSAAGPSQPANATCTASQAPPPSRPSIPSPNSATNVLPNATPSAIPSLSRTKSPAAAPTRPPKRRLSSAAASFSRVAAALGHGLMHNSSAAGGANAGVRV